MQQASVVWCSVGVQSSTKTWKRRTDALPPARANKQAWIFFFFRVMIETGAGLSRAVKKQQSSKKIKKNPHKPSQARAAEPVGETRSQRRRHWMDPPRARGAPGIRRVESGWGSRILGVSLLLVFFFSILPSFFFFSWSIPCPSLLFSAAPTRPSTLGGVFPKWEAVERRGPL